MLTMVKSLPYVFFLLVLFSVSFLSSSLSLSFFPPSCNRIECPKYDLIHSGNGFEIRRYNSSVWMSTSPIDDISFNSATRTGFLKLFDYIQGKNDFNEKIEMTAPVITQVAPSDGPFCTSSFIISFYVPIKNQPNPAPAAHLHVQKWGIKYAAVKQFSGFVSDSDIGQEASLLYESISGTVWAGAVEKGRVSDPTSAYTVAQYNSPFEFQNRVNEIWMLFDLNDDYAI